MADMFKDLVNEQYLNIEEKYKADESVVRVTEIEQAPPITQNLNDPGLIEITIGSGTSDWVLPSESYLYVEGRLLIQSDDKTTWNPPKKTSKAFPDVSLGNNAIMYLFNNARYSLNDVEIENFNYPGYITTIHGLLTNPKPFNGLDQCWAIDTYDGRPVPSFYYSPMNEFTDEVMPAAAGNPTAAEYRVIMKLLIPAFNTVNSFSGDDEVANVVDADLPCAGANPTREEIYNACIVIFKKIDKATPVILNYITQAEIPDAATATLRLTINKIVKSLNLFLVNEQAGNQYNKGFLKRFQIACNPFDKIQTADNAGLFSFRIPLKFIFNFCDQYKKVMFGCKHTISLNRAISDDDAIFKDRKMMLGKIQINALRWYMPRITPSLTYSTYLLNLVKSNVEVPIAFMSKRLEIFTVTPGNTIQSFPLTFSNDIGKPRYIVAGFQALDRGDPVINYYTEQDYNHAVFNDVSRTTGMMDISFIRLTFNGEPSSTTSYYNSFKMGRGARWYQEFKKFRKYYTGSDDNTGGISYNDFINLYRLYVFDVSKQDEMVTNGANNINIEFNFATAPATIHKTTLYCVSYYDKVLTLKADGTRQYIVR